MKVALGLSGGVDSAVAAALLKEQGFAVTGVFLECWNEPASRLGGPGCRTDKDRQDALGVALKLKIPFKVLDFKKEYRQKVLDKFYREYKAGKTPNPDIVCNQVIKFGLFLSWSLKNGFDYLATGHYARIKNNHLYRSVDKAKDQTSDRALAKKTGAFRSEKKRLKSLE
ncbi:MAG: tRNA-specific 2-thiouridylase MnmA [Candidatus Beckwithbacteria bacterium GW2011_GWA2_43_10]|uniref:tRNA-specific 2-thiouridylase MnmA n=1 Tax=Candidatus Beckwithbacteria bacterium GW2011_GWA2_43_10 TaxID=1618369 RepID=A0A0G1C3B3_9BACT|nr:MAG: tRNA-specific 2-thiouridylase MnmA [Candidatus Beckwithbacteria bacterium GW2011_GWA2_43_10]